MPGCVSCGAAARLGQRMAGRLREGGPATVSACEGLLGSGPGRMIPPLRARELWTVDCGTRALLSA